MNIMGTRRPRLDLLAHNRASWDQQAIDQQEWSRPVSRELIAAARNGHWDVHLTPGPMPREWLGDLQGKRVLGLASAGGQQGPLLAVAGARVTLFDLSDQQLKQDRLVAEREGQVAQP
jgi:2-polyprenyl-3-methyl-5-hydroxy-6-metoxy-1,4-benzoquinol methylase